MKNFLISLLTICTSFFITLFVLNQTSSTKIQKVDNIVTQEEEEKEVNTEINNSPEEITTSTQDFSEVLSDYDSWKNYNSENIDLSTDFIAVDLDGNEITKKSFLEKLKTGNYIPVKLFDSEYMYQLYRIKRKTDKKISKAVKTSSNMAYNYLSKEGEIFPDFSFKDLSGNLYTSDNTKGKTLVIQCWFVQCTQCVQEFPKVNNLYDKYESHDDILFLGLAFDDPEKLKRFLAKKEFRYPSIPQQKNFIKKELKITHFPTHIIVDEYGTIKKMVNNADSLALALSSLINDDINLNDDEQLF